jgi:hypothetical protein
MDNLTCARFGYYTWFGTICNILRKVEALCEDLNKYNDVDLSWSIFQLRILANLFPIASINCQIGAETDFALGPESRKRL